MQKTKRVLCIAYRS